MFLCGSAGASMMSSEMGAAQHPATPTPSTLLPSPGQHPPHPVLCSELAQASEEHHDDEQLQADDAHKLPSPEADPSCRAVRSSFPLSLQMQNDEMALEVVRGPENLVSSDKHFRGGAWKDEWVVSLIHLRGSMDDEFMKPQKPGIDMWSRVSSQLAEAHEDFDKNSESCRKKWQRVYKSFKDDKALLAAPSGEKYLSCKWFDLVEHYMRNHIDRNGNPLSGDEPASLEEVTHTDSALVVHADATDHYEHRMKFNAKRARKDQKIKESLSQMVETWRESLEVLKDSEAKRLEILQTLSTTMSGLLDVLRK